MLKVLDDEGKGSFAAVERALQWVVANAATYQIAAVNLSLGDGGDYATPRTSSGLGDEFDALAELGVIVVAAAGNDFFANGSRPGVAYPATDPNVLSVGAVWTSNAGGPFRWLSGATDSTSGVDHIARFASPAPAGSLGR